MTVEFHMYIHRHVLGFSSDDAHFFKVLDLPFIPQVGMEVSSGEWGTVIKSMLWDHDRQVLKCFSENHKPSKLPTDEEFEDIVAEYAESGWDRALTMSN